MKLAALESDVGPGYHSNVGKPHRGPAPKEAFHACHAKPAHLWGMEDHTKMMRKTRRRRTVLLASYLLAGAFLMQLGPLCSIVASQGVATFDVSLLLGEDESLFGMGMFYPCGEPNVVRVDQDGNIISDVLNTEDDFIYGCPITRVTVDTTVVDG